METVIPKNFPHSRRKQGRIAKYPWDDWFNHTIFLLIKGQHFHIGTGSMTQNVRNEAAKRGHKVSVKEDSTTGNIVVTVKSRKEVRKAV